MRILLPIFAVIALSGCDNKQSFTVFSGKSELGHVVFRVNQNTGEVCVFKWSENTVVEFQKSVISDNGLHLVGCANSK